MFDGVPLGCTGGVVTNGDRQSISKTKRVPQVIFEWDGCGPIASPIVGEDEDFLGIWVLLGAMALPPVQDGVCSKGRRVVANADTYHPRIG